MTNHEIRMVNTNMRPEWEWSVVRIDTVSDVETLIEEGVETTSEQALGKAKACLLNHRKNT